MLLVFAVDFAAKIVEGIFVLSLKYDVMFGNDRAVGVGLDSGPDGERDVFEL